MRDHAWRSAVKALSYRVVGSIGTMIIAFVFSGELGVALSIGAVEFVSKFLLFFAHERLWEVIPYGRKKPDAPEYTI